VLEHVEDERGFLREMARVARKYIVVDVPCELTLLTTSGKLQNTLTIGHINSYTPQSFALTLAWLPSNISVKLKNMVTANITVGTGLFNEMSQSWSDAFGAVNTTGGMTGKVNKGEAAAHGLLVDQAMRMGANCLLAVDVDYGTTANNAATINMQATAASIANLEALLDKAELQSAEALQEAYRRIVQLRRWRAGHDIPAPEVSSNPV